MTENNNPVIFLDIDGVLNSHIYFSSRESIKEDERLNNDPDGHDKNDLIDPKAVENLNEIVRNVPNVEFVLSSTWRRGHHITEMTEILKSKGFIGIINSATPICDFKGSVRGNEISIWLENNRDFNFNNYVIIDDDSDMLLHQKNNFLHVDSYAGLTRNQSYKIYRFLNNKSNWLS
jgi:hypothetical protein